MEFLSLPGPLISNFSLSSQSEVGRAKVDLALVSEDGEKEGRSGGVGLTSLPTWDSFVYF